MTYVTEKMQEAIDDTNGFTLYLREEVRLPIEDIAVILVAAAGRLWREAMPEEKIRRKAVKHAVEVAMSGQEQSVTDMLLAS